jgi:hypothetical protein
MRNVDFRVGPRVVLRIHHLRGALHPTRAGEPPWFDDPSSFELAIDTAEVAITPASLSALLNDYVFAYDDTPLKRLEVTLEKGQLKQTGLLHKGIDVPFTIRASLGVTPDGRLRLHPTSVKVIGLPVKGLMGLFGLELDDLVKVRAGRGVTIDENDFLLAPSGLLPPPRIRGRIRAVRIVAAGARGGEIVQVFGASERKEKPAELHPSDPEARNYLFYRGGVLRFGKLTMVDADLQIVDEDPKDPFDFFLAELNRQLVAGRSRNQTDFGLLTTMPDYADLPREASGRR